MGFFKRRPEPGDGPGRGGIPPEVTRRAELITPFLRDLAPFATPSQIGQPFGPGHGLEDALGLVRRHIPLDDLRPVGDMMAVSLIAPTTEPGNPAPGMYEIEDLERVMAIDWNVHDEAMGLAGAAKTFLGQHREDGENMWELWKGRDDVAAEFLCWHAVAYLRLIEIGKLPPHETGR